MILASIYCTGWLIGASHELAVVRLLKHRYCVLCVCAIDEQSAISVALSFVRSAMTTFLHTIQAVACLVLCDIAIVEYFLFSSDKMNYG